MSLDILDVAAEAFFKHGVQRYVHLGLVGEIQEKTRIERETVELWNGGETRVRRVIAPVTVVGEQCRSTNIAKPLAVECAGIKSFARSAVEKET